MRENAARAEQLAELDQLIRDSLQELRDDLIAEGQDEEEVDWQLTFVLTRIMRERLAGLVELGPWLQPPFPEYDDQAAADG